MNQVAPKGKLWICLVCGRRSLDKYGDQCIDRGWDVSCMLNSTLVGESEVADFVDMNSVSKLQRRLNET